MRSARQHPEITFLGVVGKDDIGPMRDFVDNYGIEFPNLHDADGGLWRHFGVLAQPAWIFVTAEGEIRSVAGAPNESEVERILDALADH